MDRNFLKQQAAKYAVKYLQDGMKIGVGSGTTVEYFINLLGMLNLDFAAVVSSSVKTTNLLKKSGIMVDDLNYVGNLDLYIDGADEVNKYHHMIKGGGGALTREKILAMCAKKFICIVDYLKYVDCLGEFPIAVEVIPSARSYVARELVKLGGFVKWRDGFITDNSNVILDVFNLNLSNIIASEDSVNNIVGVVECGIFAKRKADIVVVSYADNCVVKEIV